MSQQSKLALSTIGQISVTVKELDRAVAFYRDQLGMAFLFQGPEYGVLRLLRHPAHVDYA